MTISGNTNITNPWPYVLEKIREAKEKQLKELDLNWYYTLTEIPSEVFELEWLEVLEISKNKLTTIPKPIASLHNLSRLELSFNQLTTIPKAITFF